MSFNLLIMYKDFIKITGKRQDGMFKRGSDPGNLAPNSHAQTMYTSKWDAVQNSNHKITPH